MTDAAIWLLCALAGSAVTAAVMRVWPRRPALPPAATASAASAACADLAQQVIRVNHDVRGLLSPALLTADRLAHHPDPSISAPAEEIAKAIEAAAAALQRGSEAAHAAKARHAG